MADAPLAVPARGAPLPLQTQAPIATPDRGLQGAPLPLDPRASAHNTQAERARQAANEFESVFLNEMLSPMFEGLSTDGLGGGGVGEEMFRPMLIDQYAKAISHAGGIGLADEIVRELTRMQSTAATAQPESDDGPRR
ncbi:MAG: rod-binding protein [Proteobacteria bacterium]|nr:rod-binding protein [Pseudomonadota bacterium]